MSALGDPPFLSACIQAYMCLSVLIEENHTLSSKLFSNKKKKPTKKSQTRNEIPLRWEKSIFLFF